MNCKHCKKLIVVGALYVSLVASSSICKECLVAQAPDLLSGNEPSTRTIFSTTTVYISGDTGSSMTTPGIIEVKENT